MADTVSQMENKLSLADLALIVIDESGVLNYLTLPFLVANRFSLVLVSDIFFGLPNKILLNLSNFFRYTLWTSIVVLEEVQMQKWNKRMIS